MASHFYSKVVPDYGDLDNDTGRCPGHLIEIVEKDGGIGLCVYPSDPEGKGKMIAGFLNVSEAEELKKSLQAAIDRAKSKGEDVHENRVTGESLI